MKMMRRLFVVLAGLLGAVGVASAAAASHLDEARNMAAVSAMALAHAPVFLLVGVAAKGRGLMLCAAVMAVGVIVFIGDLAMRQWLGNALFPGAAPLGGGGLIVGWICVAATGLLGKIQD